jgi:hypothetical protein
MVAWGGPLAGRQDTFLAVTIAFSPRSWYPRANLQATRLQDVRAPNSRRA